MKKSSQINLIYEFLKENSGKKFTARDIAIEITQKYKSYYETKRKKYNTEQDFLNQIIAEIGRDNPRLAQMPEIQMQDKPRPRLYWYEDGLNVDYDIESVDLEIPSIQTVNSEVKNSYSEHDLYPKLIEYLSSEFGLYCLRIDEKRSKNTRGEKGNHWLHPDIVAMQAIDKDWHKDIRNCIKNSASQNVRLWSFEVKKVIDNSNVRSSFFQALSNSSWANEGYLVATEIRNQAYDELRILSDLHGIGVIVLNFGNPASSEILIPAKRKANVDWQSINRIVEENKDFADFVKYLSVYYQTGEIFEENWN